MHIKKMMNEIIKKGNSSDMEYLGDVFANLTYNLEDYNPIEYKNIEYKMYKMAYGDSLTEDMAKYWVSKMENKDGTTGEHWTLQQTNNVMSQYGIKANSYDWYAVMNMIYSDYFNPKFSINEYVELAKDWIYDKDVGNGKTLKYYLFIVDCGGK